MTEDDITTRNDENLILVNVLEELVRREVNSEIKTFDMCDCEKCRLNACAIALNALPPPLRHNNERRIVCKRGYL